MARATIASSRVRRQDPVNNALAGGIYLLPGRWNVTRNNQPQDWRLDPNSFRGILHFAGRAKPWMRWAEPALQDFYLHYARIVGIPAGYWVEARMAREALAEAFWAEQQGNFAKASAIHKRVAEAALAKLRELNPGVTVESAVSERVRQKKGQLSGSIVIRLTASGAPRPEMSDQMPTCCAVPTVAGTW